jgi:hypothetical protein
MLKKSLVIYVGFVKFMKSIDFKSFGVIYKHDQLVRKSDN